VARQHKRFRKTCTRKGRAALFTNPREVISPYASPPSLKPRRLHPAAASAPIAKDRKFERLPRLNLGSKFQPALRLAPGRGGWAPSSPPRWTSGDEQRPLLNSRVFGGCRAKRLYVAVLIQKRKRLGLVPLGQQSALFTALGLWMLIERRRYVFFRRGLRLRPRGNRQPACNAQKTRDRKQRHDTRHMTATHVQGAQHARERNDP